AEMLNAMRGVMHVVEDERDHRPRYVRYNEGLGHDGQMIAEIASDMLEYSAGRAYPDAAYVVKEGRARWPAALVTWFGAKLFCNWRGKRLPTEEEWEGAARGRANRTFPWGDVDVRCGGVIAPSAGLLRADPTCPPPTGPSDVGTATQDLTPEGVHDLGGNVTEWTDSVFGATTKPGVDDVQAPRVVRGGSYFMSATSRSSARRGQPANNLAPNGGFRCASSVLPDPSR
ncbi:MAG TPA: SUMF1/EgtB/PvdO family nonheme iron enzyme, partial [Polyangiaceae bacterium]